MGGKWAKPVAGHTVDSTLMFHIPIVEYDYAWDYWVSTNYDELVGSGEKNEDVCYGNDSTTFFTLIKTLNSTKNVLCGHDHINDFSIIYEGVRLTYAVKSSTSSYNNYIIGGTVLTISSSGVQLEQYLK
ncbi:MAG: hypothetical protein AB7S44_03680 [Spirochaetales bacterium]